MAEGATLIIPLRIEVRHSITAVGIRIKILQGIALILMAEGATHNIFVRVEVGHSITAVGVRIKILRGITLIFNG